MRLPSPFSFDFSSHWKWWTAGVVFISGFLGFFLGVEVSDYPGMAETSTPAKAYYAMGLFVLGGMDLGTPVGGPHHAQALAWFAYFGAPLLAASALIETLVHVMQPGSWRLRRIKDHIVIAGDGDLVISVLNRIRAQDKKRPIIIMVSEAEPTRLEELRAYGRVRIVVVEGDQRYLIGKLRLGKAYKIFLLSDTDMYNFEAASIILERNPQISGKIIYHVARLRLLRVLQDSDVVRHCTTFNSFHMAAEHLAQVKLLKQFNATQYKDTIVLAGFGRFGQSILEQLELHARGSFSRVAIIDMEAERRALIADEQTSAEKDYTRYTIEGDIAHPEVWQQLFEEVVVAGEDPVFILGTGNDEQNLRAAVWLRQQYPRALIISRSLRPSTFAKRICREHDIVSVNLTELMEQAIPEHWFLE